MKNKSLVKKNTIINIKKDTNRALTNTFSANLSVSFRLTIFSILNFDKTMYTKTNIATVNTTNTTNAQRKLLISPLVHAAAIKITRAVIE